MGTSTGQKLMKRGYEIQWLYGIYKKSNVYLG
jgi:hypothetical protein